jgi:argonaute-like protein implicated in RNA metabolism and viral defense
MPKNLCQYIQSPAHQWWINPTDMRRPKKIVLLCHLFNTVIKLIIFYYLPLESRSSRQNLSETCEFLAFKTLLTRSINPYQSSSYGSPLLEHKSHATWRDEKIP